MFPGFKIRCKRKGDGGQWGQCLIDKPNRLGSGYLIPNYSNNLRKINLVKSNKGKIVFGMNNMPILLNSYSSAEGSPGGYMTSPKNKF
jgi:hypothetical protein